MKYVVLISHGDFARGLKDALFMLSGEREEVISVGLINGLSTEKFGIIFKDAISKITKDDEIIILADIIGGSPLTTAINIINELEMIEKTVIIGGMNLPLALTTVLLKDNLDKNTLITTVLSEATIALKQFNLSIVEDDEI